MLSEKPENYVPRKVNITVIYEEPKRRYVEKKKNKKSRKSAKCNSK